MSKANNLNRLATFADSQFAAKGREADRGRLSAISEYLLCIARSYKTETRRQASSRKSEASRAMAGNLVTPNDFHSLLLLAKEKCESMRSQAELWILRNEALDLHDFIKKRNGFLNKWCLNFLCLLMFAGGGQRPQVYTLVRAPTQLELTELGREAQTNGVFFFENTWREASAQH